VTSSILVHRDAFEDVLERRNLSCFLRWRDREGVPDLSHSGRGLGPFPRTVRPSFHLQSVRPVDNSDSARGPRALGVPDHERRPLRFINGPGCRPSLRTTRGGPPKRTFPRGPSRGRRLLRQPRRGPLPPIGENWKREHEFAGMGSTSRGRARRMWDSPRLTPRPAPARARPLALLGQTRGRTFVALSLGKKTPRRELR